MAASLPELFDTLKTAVDATAKKRAAMESADAAAKKAHGEYDAASAVQDKAQNDLNSAIADATRVRVN